MVAGRRPGVVDDAPFHPSAALSPRSAADREQVRILFGALSRPKAEVQIGSFEQVVAAARNDRPHEIDEAWVCEVRALYRRAAGPPWARALTAAAAALLSKRWSARHAAKDSL